MIFICIRVNADCGGNASFLKTYTDVYLKNNSILFVKGIKLYDYHHGIRIRILENYSNTEVSDTITVWYCNPNQHMGCNAWDYQNTYEDEDTLICLVKPTDFWGNVIYCDTCPNNEDSLHLEKEGDYEVIPCSPSIIKYSSDKVSGWIFKVYEDTAIIYSEFKEILTDETKLYAGIPSEKSIKIYPNPARNEIYIDNLNINPVSKIVLFDNNGRLLDEKINLDKGATIKYSLADFKNGLFYLKVVFDKQVVTKKLLFCALHDPGSKFHI